MLSRASRQVFIQNRAAAFQRPGMLAVAPALNQRPAQFEFMQRSFGSDSAFLHRVRPDDLFSTSHPPHRLLAVNFCSVPSFQPFS